MTRRTRCPFPTICPAGRAFPWLRKPANSVNTNGLPQARSNFGDHSASHNGARSTHQGQPRTILTIIHLHRVIRGKRATMPHTLHRRLLCDLRRERQPHLLLFVVHMSEQRFTITHVPPRGCVCRAKLRIASGVYRWHRSPFPACDP